MKSKSLIHNTAILFVAMLATKLIGAALKIPLTNILGGDGIGYFSTAYSLFSPVLAFTSAGLPVVITKYVAQNCARDDFSSSLALKSLSLRTAAVIGVLGTALMLIIALPFTLYIANSPQSLLSVVIISPSVFFCCIASVYRGYFEGLMDMTPTAVSQVTEAVFKASLGIAFSYYVYTEHAAFFGGEQGVLPYAAAAAILGVTISEICGMCVLALYGRLSRKRCVHKAVRRGKGGNISVGRLLREALPVSVAAVVANMIGFIDLVTVPNCINLSYVHNIDDYVQLPSYSLILARGTDDLGNFVYGCYTGIVTTLFALTTVFTVIAARGVLPRISAAWAVKNVCELKRNLGIAVKYTMWLGLPVTLCFGAAAEQALSVLYSGRAAEAAVCVIPLQALCAFGIFISLSAVLFAVFHALGMSDVPLKIMLAGTGVKFLLNIALLQIPALNITGAALSTCAANLFMTIVSCATLKRRAGVEAGICRYTVKPFVSSLAAIAVYYAVKSHIFIDSAPLSLAAAIAAGGAALLLLFLIFERKEAGLFLKRYFCKRG